jgi:hypothetical protein
VFSNPEVVRRANSEFIPVALKAATVNFPPDSEEGRLYREIGRSKVAPQGICVANSAGKVLAWTAMFDNDASVLGFLDYTLTRYGDHPGGETAVTAERFVMYPSGKGPDVADSGQPLTIPLKHRDGERCLGALGVPEGTLRGRTWGRAFKDGKPLGDTTRQENYIEDRFEVSVDQQEALARALASAGLGPFELPEGLSRSLVSTAHLGMLDVNPLGAHGGQNDRKEWSFRGQKDTDRIRFEGTSHVAAGDSRVGPDGRLWSHEVKLSWKVSIEMKGNRITRLLAVAEGHEKLKWVNVNMPEGQNEVASLTGGHPIDFNGEVRYGFEGQPAAAHEIGSGPEVGPPQNAQEGQGGLPQSLQEKMRKLQERVEKRERDNSRLGAVLGKLDPLMKEGKFKEAEAVLDEAHKLLGELEKGDPGKSERGNKDETPSREGTEQRFQGKIQRLHSGVEKWQREGKDPSPIGGIMEKFEPLMKEGKILEAEALLDQALKLLKEGNERSQAPAPIPDQKIAWAQDLAAAEKRAKDEKKLVLQFLMLGDLGDPNC